jgi:hypothetical protein
MRGGTDDLGIHTSEEKLHGMSNIQENHYSKLKYKSFKHKYCTKLACVFLLHPYHTSHSMISLKLPPRWKTIDQDRTTFEAKLTRPSGNLNH